LLKSGESTTEVGTCDRPLPGLVVQDASVGNAGEVVIQYRPKTLDGSGKIGEDPRLRYVRGVHVVLAAEFFAREFKELLVVGGDE